jgi:site-specific DNA-methyltransferase (adenine-specific)
MADVVVHEGDSMTIMGGMADSSVDCVITDPPYSGKTHDGARTRILTGRSAHLGLAEGGGTRSLIDFLPFGTDDFLDLIRELLRVCRRWIVMTCDWRHLAAAEEAGLPVVQRGVWIKSDSAPQFTGDRPAAGWEAIGIFHGPGKKRWNGGGRRAVWDCSRDRSGLHPSIKPLSLVKDWVHLFSDPGDLVLDPFAGSGTTGVACMKTGRRCILIERDSRYIPVIHRRLSEAETPLFSALSDPAGGVPAGVGALPLRGLGGTGGPAGGEGQGRAGEGRP